MKITEYRNLIRQDLLDISPPGFTFSNEGIDRAVFKSIMDISRFVPYQGTYELVVDSEDHTELFVVAFNMDFVCTLAFKPLQYDSVIVANAGGTVYTLGTDYTIDHMAGTVTILVSGTIPNSTNLNITYRRSRLIFDLSSITNLLSVDRVDYRANRQTPETQSAFELNGSFLNIITVEGRSQLELSGNQRMVVYYSGLHIPPDENYDGSLPDIFSEIICIGAEAYLLFAKAISIEILQADTYDDLTSLDPYFSAVDVLFTQLTTDNASARAALAIALIKADAASTETDSVGTQIAGDITTLTTSLTNAESAITTALASLVASLGFIDTEVASDLANLATRITNSIAEQTQAKVDLGLGITFIDTEVVTDLTATVAQVGNGVTALTTAAADIVTALGEIVSGIGNLTTAATDRASAISAANIVNIGSDPAGLYAKLTEIVTSWVTVSVEAAKGTIEGGNTLVGAAREYASLAQTMVASAEARIKTTAAYLEIAKDYIEIGKDVLSQGQLDLASAKTRIDLASQYATAAQGDIEIAKTRITEANTWLEVSKTRLTLLNAYLALSDQYVKIAGGFHQGYIGVVETLIQAIGQNITLIQARIARAAEVRAQGDSRLNAAEKLRNEANVRYQDFKSIISDRNQVRRSGSVVSRNQLQ